MGKKATYNQTRFRSMHVRGGWAGGPRAGRRSELCVCAPHSACPGTAAPDADTLSGASAQPDKVSALLLCVCVCVWGGESPKWKTPGSPPTPKTQSPPAVLLLGRSAVFQALCVATSVRGTGCRPHQRLAGRWGPVEGGSTPLGAPLAPLASA